MIQIGPPTQPRPTPTAHYIEANPQPRGMEWGFFPKVVGFFPIRIFVHSCASVCIPVHFIVF